MLDAANVDWADVVEKFLFVLLGWGLGWGTEFLKEWRTKRRLKRQLIEELKVIAERLKETQLGYAHSLQLFAHFISDVTTPVELQHPIYSNFYKEICSHLNVAQRRSYEYIHGQIDEFNRYIKREVTLINEIQEARSLVKFEAWASLVRAQFVNTVVMRWMIDQHIHNPDEPNLQQDVYLEVLKTARQKVGEIVEKAKKLDIEAELRAAGAEVFRIPND